MALAEIPARHGCGNTEAIACVGTILINGNLIGIGINKPYKPKPIADLLRKHGGKTKKKLEAAGK